MKPKTPEAPNLKLGPRSDLDLAFIKMQMTVRYHFILIIAQCRLTEASAYAMAASFIPRAAFPALDSLPRSYYLGHHAAGLSKMKTMLSQIDLIIECRDYRVPLSSRNPMFEQSLAGRERLVVYTKRDLGSNGRPEDVEVGQLDARP